MEGEIQFESLCASLCLCGGFTAAYKVARKTEISLYLMEGKL